MDAQAKQQIVERVKQATNVLVTVSSNPSVDQLAACIGLTLLLNKMEKHATAVFSGTVPSTIEFLQPEKTLEANTDSLRDFIISLDKNKADKLRYKVEDQVVRIFITPYKTSLSEKDLVFSQGDINVEVVIALGVKDRRQVDAAITAHGRILHDATVISLNTGPGAAPQLGQINWQDPATSSLSEMLVGISEAFGSGLIDNQIATAFLTGIVAETDRFSNAKTSPKVMTISAQLMAAGANQQLIVSKLTPPPVWNPGTAPKKPVLPAKKVEKPVPAKPAGTLSVSHDRAKPDSPEVEIAPGEIHIDEKGNLKTSEDLQREIDRLKKLREQDLLSEPPSPPPIQQPPLPPPPIQQPPLPPPPIQQPPPQSMVEPVIVSPQEAPKPHELLDPADHKTAFSPAFTADTQPADWVDPYDSISIDPLSGSSSPLSQSSQNSMMDHIKTVEPPVEPAHQPLTLNPELPTPQIKPAIPALDNARSAVENAIAAGPFDPAFAPPVSSLNAQPVDLELHAPPAKTPQLTSYAAEQTPSLQLPNENPIPATAPTPSDMTPPAPPPVPPPLNPAPGVIIPNAPSPSQPLF
jgi:hypothetical protein